MNFHLYEIVSGSLYRVICETEEFRIVVGEISGYRGNWNFHAVSATSMMKDAARKELLTWAAGQVRVRAITERMLK